jgi:hypothetical protein
MKYEELQKVIDKYAKYVVQQSKSNLTKDKKGGGPLYDSISYEVDIEQNIFLLDFLMETYGQFVDEGVQGANPSLVKGGYQKAPMSKFKYTTKMPPMQMLADWAKKKNIRFRDSEGKYKKGSNISMGFALQRSIFAQGLKGNEFFTKPFNKGLLDLPDELLEAFALDIDNQIILGSK